MRNSIFVFMVVNLLAIPGTCGAANTENALNAQSQKAKKCLFPKSKKRAPAWVCNPLEGNLTVAAVGTFHKSGAGAEHMEQMASADARAKLVQKLNPPAQKKIASIDSPPNPGTAKPDKVLINKITEENLEGIKVLKKAYGPKGSLYVLIGFDEATSQKLLESIALTYQEQKRK